MYIGCHFQLPNLFSNIFFPTSPMTHAKLREKIGIRDLGVDFDRFRSQSEMSVNTALAKLTRVCSYNTQVGLWGDN